MYGNNMHGEKLKLQIFENQCKNYFQTYNVLSSKKQQYLQQLKVKVKAKFFSICAIKMYSGNGGKSPLLNRATKETQFVFTLLLLCLEVETFVGI
jgi:hypothetical protein